MKYVVLLGDGMADRTLTELGGCTPLEAAHTPHMDRIAAEGMVGSVKTVPMGFDPGSDVANMSVMGFDPSVYYTGRGPVEAANMGIAMKPGDVAFRMNLVSLGREPSGKRIMADYSCGHIPTEESAPMVRSLEMNLGDFEFRMYPGRSYRHIMIWSNGVASVVTTPPHDILGEEIGMYLPHGEGAGRLLDLMRRAEMIFADHPINADRRRRGEPVASAPWFWGQGTKPTLPGYRERYGITGAVVSAVDLIQGLGRLAGLDVVEVPGATGWLDTNYEGKVAASLSALWSGADFVYLHVEAPDEAGHAGDVDLKIQAMEDFDREVVGPMMAGLEEMGRFRVLLLPDHPTPIEIRTHSSEPVPFAVYGDGIAPSGAPGFTERIMAHGPFIEQGHTLMEMFLGADV
ncbi:MAG: cofactor-independent phosphoglycerate mutase [Deltaproteobacteria bacterium]|nr:cofactor-independent phosphoglycerate mutase [Candidatus Zymogenaceae bacterium]